MTIRQSELVPWLVTGWYFKEYESYLNVEAVLVALNCCRAMRSLILVQCVGGMCMQPTRPISWCIVWRAFTEKVFGLRVKCVLN